MRRFLVSGLVLILAFPAFARGRGGGSHRSGGSHSSSTSRSRGDVYVHGHTTKTGKQVKPHHRSAPDGTRQNNYSTKGNVNPYTGKAGTREASR